MKLLKKEIVVKISILSFIIENFIGSIILAFLFYFCFTNESLLNFIKTLTEAPKEKLIEITFIMWPMILVVIFIGLGFTLVINESNKDKEDKKKKD